MQATVIEGISMWSAWQGDRNLFFNSFFVRAADGNFAIDPLPDDAAFAEIAREGLAWIVVTNRDHERGARALAAATGAKLAASEGDAPLLSGPVDRVLKPEEAFLGARVIGFKGLKTPGEIALSFRSRRTVVVGDALWGDPAGSLRLMPDEKLADPAAAALSLRRLRMERPENLLLGDGSSIFGSAIGALDRCFEARRDVLAARINLDELLWREWVDGPERFRGSSAEIGFALGAERLGYQMGRVPPGKTWCPNHWHAEEEELLIVFEGSPLLQTPQGTFRLRRGDFVAFPVGPGGAHKLVNDGPDETLLMFVSNVSAADVCYYPDSRKLLVEKADLIVRDNPALDYFDGE